MFQRLCRKCFDEITRFRKLADHRLQRSALETLQKVTEAFFTTFYESKCIIIIYYSLFESHEELKRSTKLSSLFLCGLALGPNVSSRQYIRDFSPLLVFFFFFFFTDFLPSSFLRLVQRKSYFKPHLLNLFHVELVLKFPSP